MRPEHILKIIQQKYGHTKKVFWLNDGMLQVIYTTNQCHKICLIWMMSH